MTDPIPGSSDIPEVKTVTERKRSISLVWVIPIVAALIGGWLVVKTMMEQGPTITIEFNNAQGLEAGKTQIKYRDFQIGVVHDIVLSDDRQHFIVTAQLVKEAKPFLSNDARFWVVRPRFSGGQISGVGTLLSGAYIGMDPGKIDPDKSKELRPVFHYIGLEEPPAITSERRGKEFLLHAKSLGSLEAGSPINYRGFTVGDVVSYRLDKDSREVEINIFVNAPYDGLVTEDTRFWNSSGIDVKLDATGIQLDTNSVISMMIGGLSFDTPANSSLTAPAKPMSEFRLAGNREEAMSERNSLHRTWVVFFDESLRGLSVGAPVDFRGIIIGKVHSINVEFDPKSKGFVFPVTLDIDATMLRSRSRAKQSALPQATDETYRQIMNALVAKGLRAQLKNGNLLTGQLFVELDFFPQAGPAKIAWQEHEMIMPTVQSDMTMLGERINKVVAKIESMPIEELLSDARKTLTTLDETLQKFGKLAQRLDTEVTPEAVAALSSAKQAADRMEKLLAADAPVQEDMRAALQELTRAAQSVRVLTDYLETHPEALIRGKKEETP